MNKNGGAKHWTILVIDDNQADAELLNRILRRVPQLDVEFLHCTDAQSGLDTLNARRLFLDSRLGELDGLELLRRIRDEGSDVPVILLTGVGNEQIAVEAMKHGAQDYMVKDVIVSQPGRFKALERAISNAIEKVGLERRIREKQEELSRFASVVAHDLQQPLAAIRGNLEVVLDFFSQQLDSRAEEFLRSSLKTTKTASEMISGLLEYCRVGRSQEPLGPLDLNDAAETARSNLAQLIHETGARVEIEPLPKVTGDKMALTQLLQNLISNGIKFHDEQPPHVRVSASACGALHWMISVQDDGIGIPPESHAEIFSPFKRLHSRKQYPGSGIGLATCKKIVEQHGGTIRVESEMGEGTAFHFTLRGVQEEGRPAGDHGRILVVEDDPGFTELLKRALEVRGYAVTAVPDGENARKVLGEQSVDVCILDLLLPGDSGLEILPEMIAGKPGLRVIAVSGGGEREQPGPILSRAKRLGAHRILSKPVEETELIHAVEQLIQHEPA